MRGAFGPVFNLNNTTMETLTIKEPSDTFEEKQRALEQKGWFKSSSVCLKMTGGNTYMVQEMSKRKK